MSPNNIKDYDSVLEKYNEKETSGFCKTELYMEDLLEWAANEDPDPEFLEKIMPMVRRLDLRVEFCLDAPIKSIVNIPLSQLEGAEKHILKAMTPLIRESIAEAALRTIADAHPGE